MTPSLTPPMWLDCTIDGRQATVEVEIVNGYPWLTIASHGVYKRQTFPMAENGSIVIHVYTATRRENPHVVVIDERVLAEANLPYVTREEWIDWTRNRLNVPWAAYIEARRGGVL